MLCTQQSYFHPFTLANNEFKCHRYFQDFVTINRKKAFAGIYDNYKTVRV